MKINKRDPVHWLLLARQLIFTCAAILGHWLGRGRNRPRVVLYGHQLSGNLRAIYHASENGQAAGFDSYFLSLEPSYADRLEREKVRVLRCGSLKDMLLVGRSQVIITDHGLHLMALLVWLTRIRFVDVWHGIPYKGFSADEFWVQHRYEDVWVSSQKLVTMYIERFGFSAEQVKALGYARADRLFHAAKSPAPSTIREQIDAGRRIVLYAPTWRQDIHGREMFPFDQDQAAFIGEISRVCREHNAILAIRSHLNTPIGQHANPDVVYVPMSEYPDTEDVLLGTDVLICDWSSIAFDFLALKRPTIFADVPPPFKHGLALGAEYRFGSVSSDMRELTASLDLALRDEAAFMRAHESKYDEVITVVYAQNADGRVCERQVERLNALCGVGSAR